MSPRKQRKHVTMMMATILADLMAIGSAARADMIVKDNNTDDLNLTTSWVGGVVPGSGDIALWDSTVAANSVSLGSDLSWLGMAIDASHTGNITLATGKTLTLGAAGINFSPNITTTINGAVILDADQTWRLAQGTLSLGVAATVDTQGHQLTLTDRGTKEFKAAITGGGDILISNYQVVNVTSNVKFSSGATATLSDVTISPGSTAGSGNNLILLTFSGAAAADRVKSLTLNGTGSNVGVGLAVDQSGTDANTVDNITNALTIDGGYTFVAVRAKSTRNSQLAVGGSLVRNAGSVVLFNGNNLGTNAVGAGTNSSNITFGTAPSLVGGGGSAGSTTLGIIPGAFGDTTYATSGFTYTATSGLVTYDAAKGVRLLDASEYKSSITDGQTALDNVRLANSSGAGIVTTTLNSDTTINSLSFNVSGANTTDGSGIIIAGTGTLTLNSGVLFATQTVTGQPTGGNVNNKMLISVPTLDLNGREGVVIAGENTLSSTRTGGRLEISSVITNDNGNGLTFAGGVLALTGSSDNTYTGVTTVNSGAMLLTGTATALIPGDVVINGGSLEDVGNRIADTSNITINGGAFKLQIGNEGSARSETFNNLTMNGGSYGTGASNHTGASTINGTATLAGGAMGISSQTHVDVAGLTTLSGGTVRVTRSSSTDLAVYNTYLALNGGLQITNTAADPYTPLSIEDGDATHSGGMLTLSGDVTFTGNTTNANTVVINAPVVNGGTLGIVALDGARTFNIGNGAATVDLAIVAPITDGASAGGINKTGSGTLALSGSNTYTGATTVGNGTLVINGSKTGAGAINVNSGGTLGGTGTLAGILTVNAGGTLAPGNSIGTINTSNLSLAGTLDVELGRDAGTPTSDRTNVTGTVTLSAGADLKLTLYSGLDNPEVGDIFYLISNDLADAITGEFTKLNGTATTLSEGSLFDWNSQQWQITYLADDNTGFIGGNDLAIKVVPEPAALALLLVGAVGLLRRRGPAVQAVLAGRKTARRASSEPRV